MTGTSWQWAGIRDAAASSGIIHGHAFLEWHGMRVAALSVLKRTGVRRKASVAGACIAATAMPGITGVDDNTTQAQFTAGPDDRRFL
jgi:hypothetical protein